EPFGAYVLFQAQAGGTGSEPWITDGTAAGTFQISDLALARGDGDPQHLTMLGGRLLFTADDHTHARELWSSAGSFQNTGLVRDIMPGSTWSTIDALVPWRSAVWFRALGGDGAGVELWRSDGTPAGTVRAVDIVPGSRGSYPTGITVANDRLWFGVDGDRGLEPWVSDGTPSGTVSLG